MNGFSEDDCNELLAQGVMPWDDDAGAVLDVLNGYDQYDEHDGYYDDEYEDNYDDNNYKESNNKGNSHLYCRVCSETATRRCLKCRKDVFYCCDEHMESDKERHAAECVPSGPHSCEVCSAPAAFRCSVCTAAHYCGRSHQKQHFKVHKLTCSLSFDDYCLQQCADPVLMERTTKYRTAKYLFDSTLKEAEACFDTEEFQDVEERCNRIKSLFLQLYQSHENFVKTAKTFKYKPTVDALEDDRQRLLVIMRDCIALHPRGMEWWKELPPKNFLGGFGDVGFVFGGV
jgi:hypothetical protein